MPVANIDSLRFDKVILRGPAFSFSIPGRVTFAASHVIVNAASMYRLVLRFALSRIMTAVPLDAAAGPLRESG
jgi:hypothetical protein